MQDLWLYITEGGVTGGALFAVWKYIIPAGKSLYKELKELRIYKGKADVKIAKLESENSFLLDKYFHKKHGKRKKQDEQE